MTVAEIAEQVRAAKNQILRDDKSCGCDKCREARFTLRRFATSLSDEPPTAPTCRVCGQTCYQVSDGRWLHTSKSNLHGYEAHAASVLRQSETPGGHQ